MQSIKSNPHFWVISILPLLLQPAWTRGQGTSRDDALYHAIPAVPAFIGGNKAENATLNGIPKIDLRPYCPHPGWQAGIYSCNGWALGYGAMSIVQAIKNDWEGQTDTITRHAFSALFIYNQIKDSSDDCRANSFLGNGLQLLADKGNVPALEFDRDQSDCHKLPSEVQLQTAKRHRISNYARLFDPDAGNRIKIDQTKWSLIHQKPVVVGMQIRQNFCSLGPENRYWLPFAGDTTPIGGHAMVVVGYDDGKGAFELLNSWGEGWGNGGFCWLRYADYARLVWYGFQLSPDAGEPGPGYTAPKLLESRRQRICGAVILQKFSGWQGDRAQFIPADLQLESTGVYRPVENSWPVGQLFQLVANSCTSGVYIYAFSVDGEGEITMHWPRESSDQGAVTDTLPFHVPGAARALRLEKAGEEYLCLLFGKTPQEKIRGKVQKIAAGKGPLLHRIRQVFDISPTNCQFDRARAAFVAQVDPGETAAIIIHIRAD